MLPCSTSERTGAPVPSDSNAALAPRTSAASSSGSSENAESGPPSARRRVKCFSIMQAPSATAAIATSMPSVWSDSPTGQPNSDASTGNAPQVRLSDRRRIAADAMQQHEVAPARTAVGLDRLRDLLGRAHAGRHDGRLAGLGDAADQRQVDQLERRDLVGRRIEPFEQRDRAVIERRREHRDAELAALGEQRLVPLPRRMRLLVEFVEAAAVPQPARDAEVRPIVIDASWCRRCRSAA